MDMYLQLFVMMSSELAQKLVDGHVLIESEPVEFGDRRMKTWDKKYSKVSLTIQTNKTYSKLEDVKVERPCMHD